MANAKTNTFPAQKFRTLYTKNPYLLMGIVNVTPDSFSDGGHFYDRGSAVHQAYILIEEGADIIDVGGESTRPGADPVPVDEEIRRVEPVLKELQGCGALISLDTRNAKTMEMGLKYGVDIMNDVSALRHDPDALTILNNSDVMVCLMHAGGSGDPQTMQDNPMYTDVVKDVYAFLEERINMCVQAGIDEGRIMIDPGIGFGKTLEQNLALLKNIDHFCTLPAPILLGTSRKSFIHKINKAAVEPEKRTPGSISSVLYAYQKGVRIFRVHDVFCTRQALDVWTAADKAMGA